MRWLLDGAIYTSSTFNVSFSILPSEEAIEESIRLSFFGLGDGEGETRFSIGRFIELENSILDEWLCGMVFFVVVWLTVRRLKLLE